jgi:small subunit ribosomal protein S11
MDKSKLEQTVRAAQNGDGKAFETLYLEYSKRVYFFSLIVMRNKEDAEDITQDTFAAVCEKIGELKNTEAFGLWVNRIAANKCAAVFNEKNVFSDIDVNEYLDSEFTETNPDLLPEQSLENAETSKIIVDIIDNLPDVQRLCVYYYYYEQMKISEIAGIFSVNENTVKKRLYSARQKIQKEIERLNKENGWNLYSAAPIVFAFKASLKRFKFPISLKRAIWTKVKNFSELFSAVTYSAPAALSSVSVLPAAKIIAVAAALSFAGFLTTSAVLPEITYITENGNTVAACSAGALGFRGSRKSTPFAAQQAAEKAVRAAKDAGLRSAEVFVKGPGSGRESAIRAIEVAGVNVTAITDASPIAHNGCRPPKRRRV